MPYNYPEIRSFSGLHLQANSFTVPDGAMEEAENVVIKSDNIITKIRGNYLYFDASTTNNLINYNNTLLAVFSNKLSKFADTGTAPNQTGVETQFSGETVAVTGTRVSRSVQANDNLYFTSDNGVMKIESLTSSIFRSGIPPALDVGLRFVETSTGGIVNGVLDAGNQVAYRVVFGRRDANSNLLLGAPSDIAIISNDYTDGTYTSAGGPTYTITVTSVAHGLSNGMSILVAGATSANANGTFTITVTGTDTFTYTESAGNPTTGSLTWSTSRKVRLEASIPSEITSSSDGYFYQVYRSGQVTVDEDIAADFKLLTEQTLTSTEITNHVFTYDDIVNAALLASAAQLYTNPNAREGEDQANFRAPKCEDVVLFKNHVFYMNATTRALLNLQLVTSADLSANDYVAFYAGDFISATYTASGGGPYTVTVASTAHGLATNDYVYVAGASDSDANGEYQITVTGASSFTYSAVGNPGASGTITYVLVRRYVLKAGVANSTVSAPVSSSSGLLITYNSHGFSNGWTVFISNVQGGTLTSGTYYVVSAAANTFKISLTSGGSAIAYNSETQLDFEGVTDGTNPIVYFDTGSGTSFSIGVGDTSSALVKAVNRDTMSPLYGKYVSGIQDSPGLMVFQAKGFGGAIYARGNSATVGGEFGPVLPSSFSSGNQVYSPSTSEANVFYSSKVGEPEAVPLVNSFTVGARNKVILRAIALRDSVLVIKEDGIFRVTGDGVSNFTTTILDGTVLCVAKSSVKLLNNQVVLLSNQGVCLASESSVQIVSRRIDDVIQPILGGSTLESQTSAIAYESDRTYFLSTMMPNSTSTDVDWIYNILNDTWTSGDVVLFKQGIIGPSDTLYFINTTGKIYRERKSQTKIDFSGQNYTVTVSSVATDMLSAVIVSVSVQPVAGDIIIKSNIINRITDVITTGVNTYTVTLQNETTMAASDSLQLYKQFTATVKMAPFHAGVVGRMKQFAQMQLHFRDVNTSRIFLSYAGYLLGGSVVTDWQLLEVEGQDGLGWGNLPWGAFPWGLENGINITTGTQSTTPVRTYVPRDQQRSTFIQPIFQHREAGESINLQALSFSIRPYQERVTR